MALKLSNNAKSNLSSVLSASATSVTLASAANFPTLAVGDWHPLTLISSTGSYEIVRVTARSGNTLTITRAQEGTVAIEFAVGAVAELRMTEAAFNEFAKSGGSNFTVLNGINYIVSMYGPQAQLIHRIKIEMPDEDSLVWDLVPVETVPSYQSPTELLPILTQTSVKSLPAFHRGIAPPESFEILKQRMESNTTYNLQLQLDEPYGDLNTIVSPFPRLNIRYLVADFNFDNMNSYYDLADQLNALTDQKATLAGVSTGSGVKYIFNGVFFVFKSREIELERVKVTYHDTEFGGTLIKFDSNLGFTEGSFGGVPIGAEVRLKASVSENTIIGSDIDFVVNQGNSISGKFTYVALGESVEIQLSIPSNTNLDTMVSILEAAIPPSEIITDGASLAVSIPNLEIIKSTEISELLGLSPSKSTIITV